MLAIAATFAPRADASPVYGLDDCLAMAERNHPGLAEAAASVASARARLALGAAGDRLQADGSVSASNSGSRAGESESYSIGATASLKIYDANRNKYSLDASRATLSATELEARRSLLVVRTGVKEAYLALLLNHEIER